MSKKPLSVEDKVKGDIERNNAWYAANPQFEADEISTSEAKIYITREMLDSPAYRSLTRKEFLIYQDFLAKREMRHIGSSRGANGTKGKRWVIANNGEIRYPYSVAEMNGFSRAQFRDGIDGLQRKGFLDITHLGKGGRKPKNGEGDSTTYWIDNRWRDFDEKNQKAIRPPRTPREPDTRSDRGWKLFNDRVRSLATIAYVKAKCKQILSAKNRTGLGVNQCRKAHRLSQIQGKTETAKIESYSL